MESEGVNVEQTSNSETSEIRISLIIVVFVISIFILAGNMLTIISILLFTKRKNTFSLLLITLSFTEVLNILGPSTISLSVFFQDEGNDFHQVFTLCRVQAWTVVFLRIAATLIITLIGLDRVLITAMPRFYRKHWKEKLFVAFFFGTWIVAAFIATWPLLWLDGFRVSKDSQDTFCLFLYKNPFAGFFALFLCCMLVVCCLCFCTIFNMSNKKSFNTKLAPDDDFGSSKQRAALVDRDIHTDDKELTRMAAVVVALYFCCLLPWMVAITLGIFSVQYPPLFGLCALQLPMISGLLNPLIYGITWSPYRRAYIRALKWPRAKCCNRKFKKSSRSRSHNLDSTLSTGHSFWISDSFAEEDADHENAFHILFGPTSYIKPLDFKPEELEMFEQTSKHTRSSKSKGLIPDPIASKDTMRCEHGNQFQNILDFIEEMTDGNRRTRNNISMAGSRKINTAANQGSYTNGGIRSAYNTSPPPRHHGGNLELSFCSQGNSETPGMDRCPLHKHGTGCYCLGKSKCYVVETGKTQELNCFVSNEKESVSSGETVATVIEL